MSPNYSAFRGPIFKLANIFGITPYYNLSRQKLRYTILFKFHGLFLVMLSLTAIITSYYTLRNEPIIISPLLQSLQLLLATISTLSFLVLILRSSFSKMKSWERMLNLLARTECHNMRSGRKILYVFLVVCSLPGLALFAFTLVLNGISYAGPVLILYFTRHVAICLMCNVVDILKNKYNAIDNVLDNLRVLTVIESGTAMKIKDLQRTYLEADKIVGYFNAIFGWPLLLLFAETVLILLLFLAIVTEHGFKVPLDNIMSGDIIGFQTVYSITVLTGPTLIILWCDAAVQDSKRLLKKCFRLHEILPLLAGEKEELDRLRNLIRNKRPTFTAANFFEIKKSTLLSLISTATTYMIVILQFNYL